MLGALTHQLAAAPAEGDRPALAADALAALLGAGQFDRCCMPRYLALAPVQSGREVQIAVAREGDVETRVLVWPIGARDLEHPHTDGWTVFVPARGELSTVERSAAEPRSASRLADRAPVVLRPEDGVRHFVRNTGDGPALSIHVSGRH